MKLSCPSDFLEEKDTFCFLNDRPFNAIFPADAFSGIGGRRLKKKKKQNVKKRQTLGVMAAEPSGWPAKKKKNSTNPELVAEYEKLVLHGKIM